MQINTMKCQHCEKPATFHITELTGNTPEELHLCEEHARMYLMQADQPEEPVPTIAGALAQHLKISQTAEELSSLDQESCPVCGITFYEFRHVGRLGCPHDYVHFEQELEPLIVNVHGSTVHVGKKPEQGSTDTDARTELIQLRKQMQDAIAKEDYEKASEIRDRINKINNE